MHFIAQGFYALFIICWYCSSEGADIVRLYKDSKNTYYFVFNMGKNSLIIIMQCDRMKNVIIFSIQNLYIYINRYNINVTY